MDHLDMQPETQPAKKPALTQDPHKVSERRENVLEVAIGRQVRAFRTQQNMTLAELGRLSGL